MEFTLLKELITPRFSSPLRFPRLVIILLCGIWLNSPTNVSKFGDWTGDVAVVGLRMLARLESVWETGVSVRLPGVVCPFILPMFRAGTICSFKANEPTKYKNKRIIKVSIFSPKINNHKCLAHVVPSYKLNIKKQHKFLTL